MNEEIRRELIRQKARWEAGQELFKASAVKLGTDGHIRVNGYRVHTDPVSCECPDFKNRKQSCKHVFAVLAYFKGKQNGNHLTNSYPMCEIEPRNGAGKSQEAHNKDIKHGL